MVSGPGLVGGRAGDLAAVPLQGADRGDDRGRAAGEHLGDLAAGHALAPLVDGELPLLDLVALLLGQLDDRRAGDALEDGAGLGGDDVAVGVDEVHVHPAELLDVLPLGDVEEDHLVAAVGGGLLLRDQRAGVVAAGLGRAHAAAAGAGVVLGEPQGERLDPALEVGARRGGDHHERHVLRRADPEEHLRGDHERPQVEALLPRPLRAPSAGRPRRARRRPARSPPAPAPGTPAGARTAPSAWRSPRGGRSRSTRPRAGRPSCPRRSPARSAARRSPGPGSAARTS